MHFFCIFFQKYLVNSKKSSTFAPAFGNKTMAKRVDWNGEKRDAEIAQLVEHDLAKVGVASSSLVFRSPFWKYALQHAVGHISFLHYPQKSAKNLLFYSYFTPEFGPISVIIEDLAKRVRVQRGLRGFQIKKKQTKFDFAESRTKMPIREAKRK